MKEKRITLSPHSWWNIAHNSHLPLLKLSVSLFNFFHLDLENISVICYFCNEMLIYASLCWQHYPALSLQGSAGCQSPETPRWCWTIRDRWPFLPLQWKNYLKAKTTVEIRQVKELMAGAISGLLCCCDYSFISAIFILPKHLKAKTKEGCVDL